MGVGGEAFKTSGVRHEMLLLLRSPIHLLPARTDAMDTGEEGADMRVLRSEDKQHKES